MPRRLTTSKLGSRFASPFWSKWVPLSLILLTGFALRAYRLGDQNVWWDEALAIWARRKGFLDMTLWTASDVHPPLFFWSLFGITAVGGQSEFVGRFASLLFAILTLPMAYQVGRKLAGQRVGLLAASFLALARFHIWWSQEMRMYMLAGLLGMASLYFLISWWERERAGDPQARRWLIPYVVASAGALYTLYLSVLVLAVGAAFVFLAALRLEPASRWRAWRRGAAAQMVTVLLFVPWLALALPRMSTWSSATPFDFGAFLQLYVTSLSLGISTHVERYTWAALPMLGIALAGVFMAGSRRGHAPGAVTRRQGALLLALCLTLPPLAVFALSRPRSLFYSPHIEARYLLPFAPPFYILLAWGVHELGRRAKGLGLASLAFVVGAFAWALPGYYEGRYLRDELQTLVRTIAAHAAPGDAVCVVSGNRYPVFDYYYNDPKRSGPKPPVYYLPQGAEHVNSGNLAEQWEPILAEHPRTWLALVDASLQDAEGLVEPWLAARRTRLLHEHFAHNSLSLYAAGESELAVADGYSPGHQEGWPVPGLGHLSGYELPSREYGPGSIIRLALLWENVEPGLVEVDLRDGQDRLLESRDSALEPDDHGRAWQRFDFPVYEQTPRGAYSLYVKGLNEDVAPAKGHQLADLDVVYTEPWPRMARVQQPLSLDVGHVANLEGYSLKVAGSLGKPNVLHPGGTLELTLYWRAAAKMETRYTVFTHLLGEAFNPITNGPVWGQHDSEAMDGGWPTTQWFPGELFADTHPIVVPENAPPGPYQLEVGLYDVSSGARLPIWDNTGTLLGDRTLLDAPPVRPR